jgi:hypothetical protein
MFIKYNPKDPHVKTIPVVVKTSGSEGVPLANDSVSLRPGTNELTESQWAAIQPHVHDEINRKIIIPFTVEVKKDGKVSKARTLKDVPVSVARKIIESCQNVSDLKKWARQELPDEIMLLVLKRLRKFKIDPDELGYDLSGEEDTLDADIAPEGNEAEDESVNTEAEEESKNERVPKKRGRKTKGGETKSKTGNDDAESGDEETPNFGLNIDGDDGE